LAAEFGAEVIKLEAVFGDVVRTTPPHFENEDGLRQSTYWAQDSRNKLAMSIDFRSDEGKEIFKRLLEISDIWIESSIPGTYPEKYGISDEWVWSINPKMVIVHESGFGQTGPYSRRPSYDMLGQAFGGLCDLNGFPDGPPMRTGSSVNDSITAIWCLWSALAAYISAQRTGKGQAVDVAQYEAQYRMNENRHIDYLNLGKRYYRSGNSLAAGFEPFGIYKCKDDYLAIAAVGATPFNKLKKVIPEFEKYEDMMAQMTYNKEIKATMEEWFGQRTALEAENALVEAGVPVAAVMDEPQIAVNPQYIAREMTIEWDDPVAGRIKGTGIVPKFMGTPGKVWRGAPVQGQDTDAVLTSIGFNADDIAAFKEKRVVK
jgi:crotonobetainyl-CoA:carnitine CoA-transferase CaiB-like acyl-CoA transferase